VNYGILDDDDDDADLDEPTDNEDVSLSSWLVFYIACKRPMEIVNVSLNSWLVFKFACMRPRQTVNVSLNSWLMFCFACKRPRKIVKASLISQVVLRFARNPRTTQVLVVSCFREPTHNADVCVFGLPSCDVFCGQFLCDFLCSGRPAPYAQVHHTHTRTHIHTHKHAVNARKRNAPQ
jgi:hypothetical protein